VTFSDLWTEARFKRQNKAHQKNPDKVEPPSESERYALHKQAFGQYEIPILAARAVEIDGTLVSLFGSVWSEVAPGHFRTEVIDTKTKTAVLRINRIYQLIEGGYQLDLVQTVENASSTPHDIRWISYGPGDLDRDRGSFIEVRRFHFGYLMNLERDPAQASVQANGQLYERGAVLDRVEEASEIVHSGTPLTDEELDLWPNRDSLEQDLTLSWFGATNRYFALAVMAPYAPPGITSRSFADTVESVRPTADLSLQESDRTVFTELHGPIKRIAPGAAASWNMGVYFGPLERSILASNEQYVGVNLQRIIVYLMSGCCTFCTFSWLANFLVIFLAILHDNVVFDWALAIVVLVVIVRTLLHPLMKRGQIQMLRMGKLMSELKPELDALQKKYKNEPARIQQEQRRLFMERGVNPLGCVGGMLPTFLQMPIWIALYAVLFFAFELRQQAAFFGIFQFIGDWSFLGDLSRPDHFVEFAVPVNIYITDLSGINVLPLLMGLMFYLQQKYMSPPPSPSATPEQLQQQKLMKIMMVVLFPVMLYQAPSGLTLYILTSSSIGILEGRRIRRHVESMDNNPTEGNTKTVTNTKRGKKPKDKLGRMFADKLEQAREKQLQKRRGPVKNFKKREK
jgi:YidC/Oxa1 family membrane protein insertase